MNQKYLEIALAYAIQASSAYHKKRKTKSTFGFEITRKTILEGNNYSPNSDARMIFGYLVQKHLEIPRKESGRYIGVKPDNISFYRRKCLNYMEYDSSLRKEVQKAENRMRDYLTNYLSNELLCDTRN